MSEDKKELLGADAAAAQPIPELAETVAARELRIADATIDRLRQINRELRDALRHVDSCTWDGIVDGPCSGCVRAKELRETGIATA